MGLILGMTEISRTYYEASSYKILEKIFNCTLLTVLANCGFVDTSLNEWELKVINFQNQV